MKFTINIIAMVSIMATTFAACTKDSSSNPEESPFFSYLTQSSVKIDTISNAAVSWDYGFQFSTIKNGKITKLGLKMPITGSFKVRLWDIAADSIINEQMINEPSANAETFVSINPVITKANTNMGITITAKAFYKVSKTNASAFSFPAQQGNINIMSYREDKTTTSTTASPSFPPSTNTTTVAPCVNVTFVAD